MSLNLRQIEIFRAVMTTGSISGASQLLFVSQPAVSRLLSHTEMRVGFPLFERIKGRLYATPEAKKLFHEVSAVYDAVKRVNALATDLSKNRSGIVNVVASPSIGQMLLPQAIAQFRRLHPDVKLTFQCLGYDYLKERLLSNRADVGITILPMEHPNLEATPFCDDPLVCALPQHHPLAARAALTLADLRPYPLISYERDSQFGTIVGRMYKDADEPLNASIEVGSPQNATALVQTGAGVALVDKLSVLSWGGRSTIVVRPVQHAPVLQANIVHTRFEPPSQLTLAFIAQLRELAQGQYGDEALSA